MLSNVFFKILLSVLTFIVKNPKIDSDRILVRLAHTLDPEIVSDLSKALENARILSAAWESVHFDFQTDWFKS